MDKVIAIVKGERYEGWTDVTISRALKAGAGEIKLSLTSPRQSVQTLPNLMGESIHINIGDERIATGYISEFIPSYDADEIRFELVCFDKTIDLVDCAVEHESGQWNDITLDTLAKLLCSPFDINVVVETSVGEAFATIRLEQGETVFELLERLSRQRGVLLTSNAFGDLVITVGSEEKLDTRLALGFNILASRGRFSERERFNKIIIKGQGQSQGWSSDDAAENGGRAVIERDSRITRYRPHIILMEENFTVDGASRRGKWQISHAVAQGNSVEITVAGWRMHKNFTGAIWALNKQVKVVDDIMGIDEYLLISMLSFSQGEDGRNTVITLVPPDAMIIEPAESPEIATTAWKT